METDEEKFVRWLQPHQKKYKIFDLKEFSKQGDWNKTAYYNKKQHKRFLICWLGRHSWIENNYGFTPDTCRKCKIERK